MRFIHRNRMRELEGQLQEGRPEPSAELLRSIVERAGPVNNGWSLRLVFAVVSAATLAALGYLGAVSYASSSVGHAASSVWSVFNFERSQLTTTNGQNSDDDEGLCTKSSAECEHDGPPHKHKHHEKDKKDN
jgi:hypothetical protein